VLERGGGGGGEEEEEEEQEEEEEEKTTLASLLSNGSTFYILRTRKILEARRVRQTLVGVRSNDCLASSTL
jgi:hypothetical protein